MSLHRLIRRLFSNEPRASIADRQTLIYRENGRKMTIAGEMLIDGFQIYAASIVTWDDSDGELIDEFERQRILHNVRSLLDARGARVVVD